MGSVTKLARIGSLVVQLVLLSAGSAQASALSRAASLLPDIDAPPQGEAQWIAKSMRMNGLPMTLKAFHSRLSPGAVLHHYDAWSKSQGGQQITRWRYGEWHVLAIGSTRHLISIQARATREGSHGTIAVSAVLEGASLKLDTAFPIPPTARVVNLQQYDDLGLESEHISLSSARAPHVEAFAFSQLLAQNGWQLVREHATNQVRRGYVLEAQKGAQHARLTLIPDQASTSTTIIMIIWKKT